MTPVQWALRPVRKLTDFRGRSPRAEYWWWVLLFAILFGIAQAIDLQTGTAPRFGEPGWATLGLFVVTLLPSLAVSVRRLHDVDRSGWNLLWYIVPLVGTALMVIHFLTPGSYGANRYGPDPLSTRHPLLP